ncbi:MAG: hypothetical protein V1867_04740 [Candidatus Falkowbacteria bacterium]
MDEKTRELFGQFVGKRVFFEGNEYILREVGEFCGLSGQWLANEQNCFYPKVSTWVHFSRLVLWGL